MTNTIRLLRADEIDCRVSTVSDKGCSILLYKDARVDQNILDETYGSLGWMREHQTIDGNLYCTVSVWDSEKEQWVSKQDVGTESYTEKEKGQASDSFKRACFNFGIGRELYTAPWIWISVPDVKIIDKNGKKSTYDKFKVKSIAYDEERRTITRVIIVNEKGKQVFPKCFEDKQERQEERVTKVMITVLEKEMERTGVMPAKICDRYGVTCVDQLDVLTWQKALNGLKNTRSKE